MNISLKAHLRPGNIVQTIYGRMITVKNPGNLFCSAMEDDGLYTAFGLVPVPLTYQILIVVFEGQVRFEDDYYEYDLFEINGLLIIFDRQVGALVLKDGKIIHCIDSVHELQNILHDNAFIEQSKSLLPKLKICQSL